MFRDKQSSSTSGENEAIVHVVHSGRNVMMRPGYQKVVSRVKELVEVPDEVFEHTYRALMDRYAQFVQGLSLPGDKHKTLMLDQSLRRALGMLVRCAPKVKANRGFGFNESRLIFAMFSAALLYGIGRVCQDRLVIQCTEQGRYIKTWYPNAGAIDNGFYKVRATSSLSQDFVIALHRVYAQVILPNMCPSWLLEDERLYLIWEAALEDFRTGFSDFEIELHLDQFAELIAKEIDLDLKTETILPPETLEGEAFWSWLQEKIKNDKSVINKEGSGIQHVNEGFLLELDKLINEFMQTHQSMSSNISSIAKQFGSLGITATGSYQIVMGTSPFFRSEKKTGSFMLIDKDQKLFNHQNIDKASVNLRTSDPASNRFFARVSGSPQQFMVGFNKAE